MAIYYMNSKTFFHTFLEKEDPEKILDCQYVIISESIRRGSKDRDLTKKIIIGSSLLFPSDNALSKYRISKDHQEYKDEYWDQLDEMGYSLLATLVKSVLEENYTIILLCTKADSEKKFMQIIAKWVWENLGFQVYNYKAYKNGKEKPKTYNPSFTLKTCNEYLKKAKKESWNRNIKTVSGRKKLSSGMTKKEKIKMLKSMNLYIPNMGKKEIEEAIELFFIKSER